MYKFTHYCSLISISIKSGLGGGRSERDRNLYRSDGKEQDRRSLNKLIYKKAAICILQPRNWRADTQVMRLRRVSGEGGRGSGRTSGSRGSRSGGGGVGRSECWAEFVKDGWSRIWWVQFLLEVFFRIKGSQWLVVQEQKESEWWGVQEWWKSQWQEVQEWGDPMIGISRKREVPSPNDRNFKSKGSSNGRKFKDEWSPSDRELKNDFCISTPFSCLQRNTLNYLK